MKKPQNQYITSLPASPEQERHTRMVKYLIAMSVRLLCVVLCFFVQGWLLVVVVIAALVLPYVAVVAANTVMTEKNPTVLRPGGLLPVANSETSEENR
ncbi:MAG TPA: DUF3099 domain-containing protein [Glaciihabitans sp.]|jgi:hypothetical protein|nr:DUF3099 domain-containing protein [Glaciihabitans sp.]